MGIELYWDDDTQEVMLIEVGETWTWDEMHAAVNTIKRIADDPASPFAAAIVDVRRGVNLPTPVFSATTLNHARRVISLAPDGTGPIVVVGVDGLLRKSAETLRKLDRRATANIHFADTLDEARQHINAQLLRTTHRAATA